MNVDVDVNVLGRADAVILPGSRETGRGGILSAMATAPFGFLRVGAACPPVRVADPDWNVEQALRFAGLARDKGVQVLALPELFLTGYTCGDLFFSLETLVGGAERALARLMAQTAAHPMVVAVGLPVASEGLLFNCAAVVQLTIRMLSCAASCRNRSSLALECSGPLPS